MTMSIQQKIIPDPTKKVCIVSRNEILPLAIKRDGKIDPSGELRIFHANEALENILQPSSDFSIANKISTQGGTAIRTRYKEGIT